MNRLETITAKVRSNHGNHFVHVEHDGARIVGLSISSPGKFNDSALGELLISISDAANAVIAEIGGGE